MKTLYFKLALCFFLLLAGNATQGIWAQQEPIQIAGIVLDEHGDPLPGANISVIVPVFSFPLTDMFAPGRGSPCSSNTIPAI